MRGDGNGFVDGSDGVRRWGRFGSAGLFLVSGADTVLLQHRALWTNMGGTWALPGGARDSHESAREAALREAEEETGLDVGLVHVIEELVTTRVDGWTYTTVVARCAEELPVMPNAESLELRWVHVNSLSNLPLLSPFANSLPKLTQLVMRKSS
ncbi:NUDIX domain-containing protein [Corynebacterium glucuronolyticum]